MLWKVNILFPFQGRTSVSAVSVPSLTPTLQTRTMRPVGWGQHWGLHENDEMLLFFVKRIAMNTNRKWKKTMVSRRSPEQMCKEQMKSWVICNTDKNATGSQELAKSSSGPSANVDRVYRKHRPTTTSWSQNVYILSVNPYRLLLRWFNPSSLCCT